MRYEKSRIFTHNTFNKLSHRGPKHTIENFLKLLKIVINIYIKLHLHFNNYRHTI